MIKVIKRSGSNTLGLKGVLWEFTCDSTADITDLPTSASKDYPYSSLGVRAGSNCICTEDGSIHMLGADDHWHKL